MLSVVVLASGGFAVDRRLVANIARIVAVDAGIPSGERGLHPAQGRPRADELIALARRHAECMSGSLAKATFALVLLLLALVLHPFACVGIPVPPVRIVVAAVRESVPLVRGDIAKIRGPIGGDRTLGGAPLILGVPLLVLVPLERVAVQLGGHPMKLDERGLGRLGHEALAAFRGLALAAGVLAREVTVLLGPPRQLARVVGSHHLKVLRAAPIRDPSYERLAS